MALDDQAAREVAAMQFAGGMSIDQVAEAWERDAEWVEDAIRQAMLKSIPRRDGGLKAPRTETRAENAEEMVAAREAREGQGSLVW